MRPFGEALSYRPELGTTIVLLPRDGGRPIRLEYESLFMFHVANAYEDGHETVVDIVTDRALAFIEDSPVAGYLAPNPAAAVEFMVGAVCAELLSPARFLTHADIANRITDAIYRPGPTPP
ncbi:carotenoid oxygenase family protein [Gordonia paraffinivorans]|uniref:carotenoid oxygenase family protein n=1 Tax=Gordonia paraffinivorans TaxID=175628 RepID=UPI001FFA55ED|nr:carotenoid oxygenase family protein [Gordonia paraffinivorans]